MKKIILIILSFILITNSQSQIPIDSATMYLTGTFKNYNPQRAFQINLQNATNGNAKAMNAVAMQYTKGLGVDSNFNLAAYWFNQAATNGYTKALVNLGMLYKHNATDSNGYAIACNYFNQAVLLNEPSSFFAQGYMYYKGLGCTQSYTSALNLFNQGIAINQSNCMYFKGLCYKYGYGVTSNNDSATFYIDSAAHLGYKQANAELYNNNQNPTAARTSSSLRGTKQSQNGLADFQSNGQNEFQHIAKTNKSITINGEYTGALNQYDYSGKKLIAQIPITLQVSTNNSIVTGDLFFNNSQSIQLKAIQQGNQLIFSQTVIARNEAISTQKTNTQRPKTSFVFKSATVNIQTINDTNFLTGSLVLFNSYTHETDKPINIKLVQQKTNDAITKDQRLTPKDLAIFPNPTKNNITITFTTTTATPVKLSISNMQGQVVYTKVYEQLQQGRQNITLNPPLVQAGIYILKLAGNNINQSTAFIKE